MRLREYLYILLTVLFTATYSCSLKTEDILTSKERIWLQAHPNIKIAVSTSFPPFQFIDENNNSVGISIDVLNLLEENINYKFEKVYYNNWKKILDAGKSRDVDVIPEIQETLERKDYFHFTKAFISIPHVIIMRKESPATITIDELENLKVGVVDNYAVHEHLINLYPELSLHPLPDDLTCLLALSNQNLDAVITQQGYATYKIHEEVLSNLQIVGNIEYDNELGFAVRKDWSILARIIDKGLSRITQKKQKIILNKWIPILPEPFWKTSIFWIIVTTLIIGFLIFSTTIYFWNKLLRKRVAIKTYQLKKTKEKAEESNLLKSSFLANMSHEIRTPLNAIQGFSELLSNEDLDLSYKKKYVEVINSNCKSLTKLIDEILDLSKIESGLISIQKQKINLTECIQEVIDTNTATIPEDKNLKIQYVNELKTETININTDPLRLKQILNNLICNAIKFSTHGVITITTSYYKNSEVLFCVEDEGIGMEESQISLIFDRFTKIEKNPTILYRGSGLGLNICKKLLELMNGKIWVKSTMGHGSSFYFTLPFN